MDSFFEDLSADPGLVVCIVALLGLAARAVWIVVARRRSRDLGWSELERESKRSPRRYVRESTTTTSVQPLSTRVPGSRITNHVPKPPPKDSALLDG